MEILCMTVIIECAVIIALLGYKILMPEKRENIGKAEAESEEVRIKQEKNNKAFQEGLDAIQNYDINTALKAVTDYGADNE